MSSNFGKEVDWMVRMSPRYIDNIADVILNHCDIITVISRYVPLKKAGRNHKALCPFHGEKTPSFVVSEEKQLFHCFGCGTGGTAIQFVMLAESLEFIEAVEVLAEQNGLDLRPYEVRSGTAQPNRNQDQIMEAMRDAANFYYKYLQKRPNIGYEYMRSRGVSDEMIREFGLGYSPEQWNVLMQYLKSKKYSEKCLEQAGLIVQKNSGNGYYDRFRNRVMFPIQDGRGRVIAFGGRVLDDSMPKYLNSPEGPVFDKSRTLYGYHIAKKHLGDAGQLIMVEGYMDVVSLHQWGIRNAVATLGTAMTEKHAALVKRSAKEVVLAYDSDSAGIKATLRGLEILSAAGLRARVVQLGTCKDPDEYIRIYGKEGFQKLIEDALPGTGFILAQIERKYNLESGYEQLHFLDEAVNVLKKVDNTVEVENYVKQLSEKTRKSQEAIYGLLKNHGNSHLGIALKELKDVRTSQNSLIESPQLNPVEAKVLEAAVQSKSQYKILQNLVDSVWWTSETAQAVWQHLETYYEEKDIFSFDSFIDNANFVELKILHDSTVSTVPLDNPERELKVLAERLHVQYLKELISHEEERVKNKNIVLEKSQKESIIKRLYELKKELSDLMAGR